MVAPENKSVSVSAVKILMADSGVSSAVFMSACACHRASASQFCIQPRESKQDTDAQIVGAAPHTEDKMHTVIHVFFTAG